MNFFGVSVICLLITLVSCDSSGSDDLSGPHSSCVIQVSDNVTGNAMNDTLFPGLPASLSLFQLTHELLLSDSILGNALIKSGYSLNDLREERAKFSVTPNSSTRTLIIDYFNTSEQQGPAVLQNLVTALDSFAFALYMAPINQKIARVDQQMEQVTQLIDSCGKVLESKGLDQPNALGGIFDPASMPVLDNSDTLLVGLMRAMDVNIKLYDFLLEKKIALKMESAGYFSVVQLLEQPTYRR